MAETQEYEMNNGEFGQGGEDYTQDDQMNGGGTATENGGGDAQGDSGNAEASGKDDERYAIFTYYKYVYLFSFGFKVYLF